MLSWSLSETLGTYHFSIHHSCVSQFWSQMSLYLFLIFRLESCSLTGSEGLLQIETYPLVYLENAFQWCERSEMFEKRDTRCLRFRGRVWGSKWCVGGLFGGQLLCLTLMELPICVHLWGYRDDENEILHSMILTFMKGDKLGTSYFFGMLFISEFVFRSSPE